VCCQAYLDNKPECVVVGDAATEWICDYAPWIRGQGLGVDGRSNAALTAQTEAAAAAAPALAKRLGGEQKCMYKSSHNVLRAVLAGLKSWGSIKKVMFVMKMAVKMSVVNLKIDSRRP
jgi:hypothetical protein